VALNVLLADDSVPAQNMGKKILAEAGFDVTTVSNGLEAIRKIAETVPDIAILDIFMPGYTGLEVCQKLRASVATAALPVILTVGKLEPYRPEDGERVHSNAVIVKPFAAAELIAAVRSLIGGPATPVESAHVEPLQAEPVAYQPAPAPHQSAVDSLDETPLEFDASASAPATDPADEPLFSYGAPAANEMQTMTEASEFSVYGTEPLLAHDLSQPESLVYNPDATHTPFSASVAELLPSMPQGSEEIVNSPFTDFNLEPQKTESLLEVPEITSPPAEFASAPSVENTQPPILDIPPLDPLLETGSAPPIPAGILDDSHLEVSDLPEETSTVAPAAPESQAEVLTPEEEARRKAFEELFNSTELPPLEEPLVAAEHHEPPPELASPPEQTPVSAASDAPFDLQPAAIVSSAPAQNQPLEEPVAPAPTEAEPVSAAAVPEPLLHNAVESVTQPEPQPIEETLAPAAEPFTSQPAAVEQVEAVVQQTEAAPGEPAAAEGQEEAETLKEAVTQQPETTIAIPPVVGHEVAPPAVVVAEPQPVEPQHEHVEAHAEKLPVEGHTAETHSRLSELAELASGVGLAAALPKLAHLVESEVKHAFAASHPAPPEPEVKPSAEAPTVEPKPVTTVETSPAVTAEPAQPVFAQPVEAEPAQPTAEPLAAASEPTLHVPVEPETIPVFVAPEPEQSVEIEPVAAPAEALQPAASVEPIPEPAQPVEAEPVLPAAEPLRSEPVAAHPVAHPPAAPRPPEAGARSSEAERVHQAVERVFDRFKPLLVAAIVRELARHD
jgi:CheY-like chemotaxis protein